MNATLTKPESHAPNGNGQQTERVSYLTPVVNIREDQDGYVLEAEMPGVDKDGLQITVENSELVIIGRRQPAPKELRAVYRESRRHDFRRAFELDPSIDTSKISARIDQGVLSLRLPKTEAVKPRKIEVIG